MTVILIQLIALTPWSSCSRGAGGNRSGGEYTGVISGRGVEEREREREIVLILGVLIFDEIF